MKNFFKKLSFVLASAMVITSLYAPANTEAASNFVREKGSKKAVTSKDIFVGGRKVNFDYTIGKKMTGIHGTWKSSDTSVAVVDKKTGLVKGVGNGEATISFKTKKTKTMKKSYTIKTKVNVFTRAEKVELPATAEVKMGESTELMAKLIAYAKAGSSVPTYNLVATSSDEKIATVVADGDKLTVMGKAAGEATLTVYARHKDGDKYDTPKVEVKVTVKAGVSAQQVGVNKIKVMGTDLSTDASLYVLKNAQGFTFTIKKDSVKVNEAKTEAEFETEVTTLRKNTYKLSFNKSEEVSFEVEEAKSAKVVFLPEGKASISGNKKKATILFKVLDQFGTDITKKNIVDLSVNTTHVADQAKAKKGVIEVTKSDGGDFNPFVDKIYVTIVDIKNPTTTVTSEFVVEMESKAKELSYKGLYDVKSAKFIDSFKQNYDGIGSLYVLFSVKDQYDRDVEPSTDLKDSISLSLISATGLEQDKSALTFEVEVKDVKYLAFQLKALAPNKELLTGEVTVQAISKFFGTMVTGKFNVVDKLKVNTLRIEEPSIGIFNDQENTLVYEALDIDGNQVYDVDALNEVVYNSTIADPSASNASLVSGVDTTKGEKFIFERDPKTGKAVLKYLPKGKMTGDAGTDNSTVVSLSGTTKTYKPFFNTFYVKNKRVPQIFTGISSDAVTGATSNHHLVIKVKDLRFQDQYSGTMTAKDVIDLHGETAYEVTPTVNVTNFTGNKHEFVSATEGTPIPAIAADSNTHNAAIRLDKASLDTPVINIKGSADNKGSVKAKLVVTKGMTKDNEKELVLTNVFLSEIDVNAFTVKSPELVPVEDLYAVGAAGANADFGPEVFGTKNNIKIKLAKDEFTVKNGVDENNAAVGDRIYFKRPVKDQLKDVTSTTINYTVIINNGKATEVNGTYTVSKAAPVVTKVTKVGRKNNQDYTFEAGQKPVHWTDANLSDENTNIYLLNRFELKDQYGVVKEDVAPYITYTFSEADLKKLVGEKVTNNGFATATFTKKANTTVTPVVKLDFPGSGVKFEEVIKFE